MRTKRLRHHSGTRRSPLRQQCVAGGDEAVGNRGRTGPDDLAIGPVAKMIEGERERNERRALHERKQYRETGGIDLVEKRQRQVQSLGAQHTSAAFRMSRDGPCVKLLAYARPGP